MFGSSNRYDFDEYESFTEMLIATGLIWWLVVVVIAAVVMGCVTKKINEDRGYSEGFLWGFLLGVIGIVIVTKTGQSERTPFRQHRLFIHLKLR